MFRLTPPLAEELDRHAGLLDPDQKIHHARRLAEDLGQGPGETGEGPIAGSRDDGLPAVDQRRQETGSQERALPRSRGTDDGQKMRPPQLLPQRFDLELTAEEEPRVLLLEGGQARIRSRRLVAGGPEGDLLERPRQG